MAEEVKIRAFLGLPLAKAFEPDLRELLRGLKGKYPLVRWIDPASAHVTLHFFGSITSEQAKHISTLVKPMTTKSRPLKVFLQGVGGFPNLQHPRVIWVGMGGETQVLKSLQDGLEREFAKAGFECEKREFKPHLTLGRVKDIRGFGGITPVEFGPTTTKEVNEVILFQSRLSPQGSIYEAIETYPLSAP